MTPEEIGTGLRERFGDAVLETVVEGPHPFAKVAPGIWRQAGTFARDELGCEFLHDLTAVDSKDGSVLTVVAQCWSYANRHWVRLKADVDRADPRIDSLQPVWKSADWMERECFDMFGVRFEGHPNLRRILCPEDWVGWPLRKDYELPEYYHGIPGIPILREREAERGRCFPPRKKAPPPAPKKASAAAPKDAPAGDAGKGGEAAS